MEKAPLSSGNGKTNSLGKINLTAIIAVIFICGK